MEGEARSLTVRRMDEWWDKQLDSRLVERWVDGGCETCFMLTFILNWFHLMRKFGALTPRKTSCSEMCYVTTNLCCVYRWKSKDRRTSGASKPATCGSRGYDVSLLRTFQLLTFDSNSEVSYQLDLELPFPRTMPQKAAFLSVQICGNITHVQTLEMNHKEVKGRIILESVLFEVQCSCGRKHAFITRRLSLNVCVISMQGLKNSIHSCLACLWSVS